MDLVLVAQNKHGLPAWVVPQEIEARRSKDEREKEKRVDKGWSVPEGLLILERSCGTGSKEGTKGEAPKDIDFNHGVVFRDIGNGQ